MVSKVLLSDRVRPDCEAAPWVIMEIKKLEAKLERVRELSDGWRGFSYAGNDPVSHEAHKQGLIKAANELEALLGEEGEDELHTGEEND